MSEETDSGSRTEEPTEKRLRDARERGDQPVSREAPLLTFLLGVLVIFTFVVPAKTQAVASALAHFLDDPAGWRPARGDDAVALLRELAVVAGSLFLPVAAVAATMGVLASVAQNPPQIIPERISPKWSRISLGKGAGRIFGPRGWTEFLKSTAKFLVMIGAVAYVLWNERITMLESVVTDIRLLPTNIVVFCMKLVAAVAVATLAIAGADLVWSRLLWRRDQRMTKQEIKEELKEAEGDRLIKARLRSIRLDRSRKRMLAAVPKATMVVVNPTHYAVAMRYVRSEGGAPLVLAKGVDLIALKIREIAEQHEIAIVEDRPLARSLYDAAQVDQPIPPEFYHAVAELVHLVQGRTNKWPIDRNR